LIICEFEFFRRKLDRTIQSRLVRYSLLYVQKEEIGERICPNDVVSQGKYILSDGMDKNNTTSTHPIQHRANISNQVLRIFQYYCVYIPLLYF
jgi:hypothetical protein